MTTAAQRRDKFAEFGRRVAMALENSEQWGPDELDAIAGDAFDLGLANPEADTFTIAHDYRAPWK